MLFFLGVESLRCEDSNPVLKHSQCLKTPTAVPSTRVKSRVPVCLLDGLLGCGLERGCAGRAFSFSRQERDSSPGKTRPELKQNERENMKATMKIAGRLVASCGLACCLTLELQAQTNLQFTSVNATVEGAIQLHWESTSNALYQIQYTPTLTNIQWNTLVDNYPSQGTNTFWLDTGNYLQVPPVNHPKYDATRFYRVIYLGTNAVTQPTVAVIFPTNGMVLSDQVTVTVVAASSTLPILNSYLYVDGQQMYDSDDGTNFVINTCEWPNGPHTLFATVKGESQLAGPSGSFPVDVAYAASSYVPVTFSNLISRVAFSQPFFEPSLGQTQQVTATFAANCDWMLQIIDDSSNVVRVVTGSGNSLQFDWVGTGDGGTSIPDGVYYYAISAQTNGLALQSLSNGNGVSSASLSTSTTDSSAELWAMPINSSGNAVPLAIYPPGFDTNNLVIFEATPSEMQQQDTSASSVGFSDSMADSSSYSGPSGQNTLAPTRPPTAAVKGKAGTFGVAYYNFPTRKVYSSPPNGLGLPGTSGKVQIENSYSLTLDPIPECPNTANNFATKLESKGWKLGFNFSGSVFRINQLRSASLGGNELFGTVNLGLFMDHGGYGTSLDWHSWASQTYQTYFASDNSADAASPWIAMSEFGFGGNLRWMAVLACNSLRDDNYNSMAGAGVLPIKSNLHLLCGTTTVSYMSDNIGELWATKMLGSFSHSPETVENAWYDAGHDAYHYATNISNTVIFRVAGSDNCFSDTLKSYAGGTSGNITSTTRQVWP